VKRKRKYFVISTDLLMQKMSKHIKRGLSIILFAMVLVNGLWSCSGDRHPKTDSLSVTIPKTGNSHPSLKYLYAKDDSICIVAGKKTYCIKRDTTIFYKNSYAGIYEIVRDSIKKSYSLAVNNLIYFTTYADGVGYKGYLYIYNPKSKKLAREPDFNHNYLFSSWGIFIIDRNTNKIFSINPSSFDQKTMPIVAASMYSVSGGNFKLCKIIYDRLNNVEEDTSIMKLYRRSLADNGKHGLLFPDDSWK
jgi:hypothetical protein